MKWRYFFPLLIVASYIALCYGNIFWSLPGFLLLLNVLNAVWGEFSTGEIKNLYREFYTNTFLVYGKRITAILFLCWQIWAVIFLKDHIHGFWPLALFTFYNGVLLGCFALTLAHDLMHSAHKTDQVVSAVLLVICCCPHLVVDHILAHHKLVGLEQDVSTAKKNQSFYSFFYRIVFSRIRNSYASPQNYPRRLNKKISQLHFKTLTLQVVYLLSIYLIAQNIGLLFVVFSGAVAYAFYEIINYVQHYALARTEKDPVSLELTWNCYFKYTNYILFLLPCHSLHHLPGHGKNLDSSKLKNGPRLPYLYFLMVFFALVPPIWFRIMNPRAEQISGGAVL